VADDTSTKSVFRRGFTATFAFDILSRGLSAVVTVLLVRGLSVESFAYVILFLNVGQFAGSAATGGMRMRYMRTEAERVSRGIEEPSSFFVALAGSLTMIGAGAVIVFVAELLLGVGGDVGHAALFVGLVALYTMGHAGVELAMYHYQAHLQFRKAGWLGLLRNLAILLVALLAVFDVTHSGHAIALWLTLAVLALAIVACAPHAWRTRRSRTGMEGRLGFGAESNWLTIYYVVGAGFAYINIFLVAGLLDDEAVASFGAALRYLAIVMGPYPALLAVLRVRTSQHDVVDSTKVQVDMLMDWIRRAAVPVLIGLAVVAAAAPWVIPIVDGGRYPDSVEILQLQLIGAFVVYATLPSSNLLMSQKRYRLLAIVYGSALAVDAVAATIAGLVGGVIAIAAVAGVATAAMYATVAWLALRPGANAQVGASTA
jgi:O-antigen/teichoic acid export membrane protein